VVTQPVRGKTRKDRLNSKHVIEPFHSGAIAPERVTPRLNHITAVALLHE
jgi:hypothetical protein